ncbi:galactose-1-phosphate uridylyltransferase [Patescibacteria group bacterium]
MIKSKKTKKLKFPSELRSGPLSKDWVLIATGRSKRPETFKKEKRKEVIPSKKTCPFCHIEKQEEPTLVFVNGKKVKIKNKIPKDWTLAVIPNKYPAFIPSDTLNERSEGLYKKMNGAGYHEIVVTRDHKKQIAKFSKLKAKEVIDAYQERYLDLMNENFVNYVSIFHNQGPEAGASIFHPHSQIIAAPVIDPDLYRAILSSKNYFKAHKKCIYCLMNNWDRERKERIIFENKDFLVICPFASKTAFEMIISPKKHLSYFERINEEEKNYLAEALQVSLNKLYKALNNPPYNFYLHTAPCDGKNYNFYHWHWTILPKTATWAGFELCTGIEISTIEPEKAAEYLRKQ